MVERKITNAFIRYVMIQFVFFLNEAKLDHSEKSFKIMKTVFNDVLEGLRESLYPRSLDKYKF